MYRNTYVDIDLNNIAYNIKEVISNYKYKYYFGVVKADCYGHGIKCIKTMIESGINYLAVATLDEALEIRELYKDIPILCLGVIPSNYIDLCIKKNITITINSLSYLNDVLKNDCKNLRVHIKINSGMNRLGIKDKTEFDKVYDLILNSDIYLEGIYTHIYNAGNETDTLDQYDLFKSLISDKDLSNLIIHIQASDAITNYHFDLVSGIRLGIIMYGFNSVLKLKSTFKLHSQVVQINKLSKGDKLGYNKDHIALKDEIVGVVCIGYADGVIRKNKNRYVYINGNRYPIIGNICMDMMFVLIDSSVKLYDDVLVLRDNDHINEVSKHLDTIPYEVLCSVGKRVLRVYK